MSLQELKQDKEKRQQQQQQLIEKIDKKYEHQIQQLLNHKQEMINKINKDFDLYYSQMDNQMNETQFPNWFNKLQKYTNSKNGTQFPISRSHIIKILQPKINFQYSKFMNYYAKRLNMTRTHIA